MSSRAARKRDNAPARQPKAAAKKTKIEPQEALRTTVVFADYFREEPLVRHVDADEFVVLLNIRNDDVIVKPREDWAGDGEYVAFGVTVHQQKGAVACWSLFLHKASHFKHKDVRRLGCKSFSYTQVTIKRGAILRFEVVGPLAGTRKVYAMQFFAQVQEEKTAKPLEKKKTKTTKPPSEEPSLLCLPAEILMKITNELPVEDVLHKLPHVSPTMFDLSKGRLMWRELAVPEEANVDYCRTLGAAAKESCGRLNLHRASPECQALLLSQPWPNLRELVTPHLDFEFFKGRLASGDLPVLDSLHVCGSSKPEFELRNELRGATLPSIKKLALNVKDESLRRPAPNLLRDYFAAFPALEVLDLCTPESVEPPKTFLSPHLLTALAAGRLPNLRDLRYSSGCLSRTAWVAFREGTPFEHRRLESLTIAQREKVKHLCSRYLACAPLIDGGWLLARFPCLRTLVLDTNVAVDWFAVEPRHVSKLSRLSVHLDSAKGLMTPTIPFDTLLNELEDVRVTVNKGGPKVTPMLAAVLALPELRRLQILGQVKIEELVGILPARVNRNLSALRVSTRGQWLTSHRASLVSNLLAAFPNVTRLSLDVVRVRAPLVLKDALAASGEVVQLYVRERPKTGKGTSGDFEWRMRYLASHLGGWGVVFRDNFRAYLMAPGHAEWDCGEAFPSLAFDHCVEFD